MATSPRLPLWLACAWCAAAGAPDSLAVGGSSPGDTARSSNQTAPQASRPCAVNSPGLRVSRLSVWARLSVSNKPLALVWIALAAIKGVASGESRQPVSASSPLGTSTFRRSAGLRAMCANQSAMRPSGGRAAPMPSRASMHTSCSPSWSAAGGWSRSCTPAFSARASAARASAGARSASPSQVTWGVRPQRCRCRAASRPSPPLLPGPQAIQIVRACGASATASRATARPARCIRVWGGSWAAARSSTRRVAATLCSACGVSNRKRCGMATIVHGA